MLDVEDKLGRWLVLLPATLDSNMPSAKGESKQKKALLSDAARRPTGANSALPSPNRTAQAAPNASAAVPGAVLQRALSQENAVPASRGPDALGVAEQKLSRVGARPTNLPLLDSLVPGRRQAQVENKSVLAVRLPRIGEKLQERAIPFQGTTEPGRTVTVNGREFSVDERGGFGGSIPVHGKTARIEIDQRARMVTVRLSNVPTKRLNKAGLDGPWRRCDRHRRLGTRWCASPYEH